MVDRGATPEDLFRSNWDRLVRLAALIGGPDAAEDIVQDVFSRTYGRLEGADNPAAYLRAAVANAARSHLRRKRVERRFQPDPPVTRDRPGDEMFDTLAKLTPRRRAAVVLRFYEDMTTNEIAAALGCRPGTASSLIHRGLEDLRTVLPQ